MKAARMLPTIAFVRHASSTERRTRKGRWGPGSRARVDSQTRGIVANGIYDMEFKLYDAPAGGTQIGSHQTANNIGIIDGIVTIELTFGTDAFNGQGRWLEISIRPGASTGAYTILNPRQSITSSAVFMVLRPSGPERRGHRTSISRTCPVGGASWPRAGGATSSVSSPAGRSREHGRRGLHRRRGSGGRSARAWHHRSGSRARHLRSRPFSLTYVPPVNLGNRIGQILQPGGRLRVHGLIPDWNHDRSGLDRDHRPTVRHGRRHERALYRAHHMSEGLRPALLPENGEIAMRKRTRDFARLARGLPILIVVLGSSMAQGQTGGPYAICRGAPSTAAAIRCRAGRTN